MSAFYKGIVYKIGNSFQIVYPMKGIESFSNEEAMRSKII